MNEQTNEWTDEQTKALLLLKIQELQFWWGLWWALNENSIVKTDYKSSDIRI